MGLKGGGKNTLTGLAIFGIALVLAASGLILYKSAPIIEPTSVNQDPNPIGLQSIAHEAASSPAVNAASKPQEIVGWSSDTVLRPDASMGELQESTQVQTFPPAPKAALSADQKGLTQTPAHTTPAPPQWSGVVSGMMPPSYQPKNKAMQGAIVATGFPTSITQVTEIRKRIAAGETFFQRPKTEKTPVQFVRNQ